MLNRVIGIFRPSQSTYTSDLELGEQSTYTSDLEFCEQCRSYKISLMVAYSLEKHFHNNQLPMTPKVLGVFKKLNAEDSFWRERGITTLLPPCLNEREIQSEAEIVIGGWPGDLRKVIDELPFCIIKEKSGQTADETPLCMSMRDSAGEPYLYINRAANDALDDMVEQHNNAVSRYRTFNRGERVLRVIFIIVGLIALKILFSNESTEDQGTLPT